MTPDNVENQLAGTLVLRIDAARAEVEQLLGILAEVHTCSQGHFANGIASASCSMQTASNALRTATNQIAEGNLR